MPEKIFGLTVPTSAAPGSDPIALAVRAEDLGFDFISSSDHPLGPGPSYETWTMLCFIAAATSRIRVATRVLGIPYRHPALMAKMAETLSRLSRGRLILGVGGGSADEEQRALGLDIRSPKEKSDGLEQAITLTRGLWQTREYSFEGSLYRTENATLEPKPTKPIPIWAGTFAPRALAITGRLADGWIPSLGYVDETQLVEMCARVLAAAEKAGRDPAEITCVLNTQVLIDEHADPEEGVIVGSPEAIVTQLMWFVEQGFTSFNFSPAGHNLEEQAARLAEEVLPALRAER